MFFVWSENGYDCLGQKTMAVLGNREWPLAGDWAAGALGLSGLLQLSTLPEVLNRMDVYLVSK